MHVLFDIFIASTGTGIGSERVKCISERYRRLTEFQLSELRKRYEINPRIHGKEKELMSRNLGISLNRLGNWFKLQRR